ncbi:uncharacterized protein LOC133522970 [Cydia pomonella]|uniref:uncharacterized protein LOC133522970 n=1 Tax=Cydia pomonella TaxID=82600 RepID=UPI002ADD88D9|nr:uncharacterized protein LOC133522970 [Cydia pomonella]
MTTFGEIAEPGSRNLWEDWDDSNQDLVKLEWQNSLEAPKEIDDVIIFEGRYLSDYIKHQSQCSLINTVSGASINLYKLNNCNGYICTVRDYSIVQSSKIIELLKDYLLHSREVIAVQTKPLSDFNSTEPVLDCVVRSVSTSKLPNNSRFTYPKLEQPNIISGVAAGAISLREHLDLTGTAIVCYIEHPEDYQIEKVQKLLEKFNFYKNDKAMPGTLLNSNLYI